MNASAPAKPVEIARPIGGGSDRRPGIGVFAAELLGKFRLGFMGWLTVFLISLAVLGLVGTSWVHLGRR